MSSDQDDTERLLSSLLVRTPLVTAAVLDEMFGRPSIRLKLENRQRTGSFKPRGALYKLTALTPEQRARGVVAASAGNHGQGVALAGKHLGIDVTVFVPGRTPAVKCERIRELGARLVVQGAVYDEAEAAALAHAMAVGAVFVSPFDDELVIEGNGGTMADELIEQAPDLALVVCPVGGGGLIAGLARRLARHRGSGVRIIGVQPEANCAMHESLIQGRALTRYTGRHTLAEGLEGAVAELTYSIVRQHVERIALVSEDAIRRAVAFGYRKLGQVLEPSGAVALAGILERAVTKAPEGSTVCVLTGANIDPALLDEILAEG
jgi:threonine dehydratase